MFSSTAANYLALFIATVAGYLVLDHCGVFGPRRIKNIPSVPSLPVVGNLLDVLDNPAKQYSVWAEKYGDVFQMRMGNKIVVVANSFDTVKELWIKNRDANNSRPVLFTFHNVVSATQGFTIGTTPYGESYKKKKKIVATALNKRNVEKSSGFIAGESRGMFRRIDTHSGLITPHHDNGVDIDAFKLMQGFVLRVSLYLTYGYLVKVEHTDRCKLFEEISHVENRIVRLRGHSSNLQDYLPMLRYLPSNAKNGQAADYRNRRDVYMAKFKRDLVAKIEEGTDYKDCIVSRALDPQNTEFPEVNDDELRSVCLTMVSAGLDNTPLVLNHILGHLSQPEYGERLQDIAYNEILKVFETPEMAFASCIEGYTVDYVHALLKEGLRYFSVLPTSLPRTTTKDIIFRDSVIPAGTIMFLNVFGANHDTRHFDNPFVFAPERFLDEHCKLKETEGTTLFTFGAGARMCAGSHLAMKEMYISLVRFILLYKILPPTLPEQPMELNIFKLNAVPDSVAIEPDEFKIRLVKRDPDQFHKLVWLD
ncbi:hypothetical protein WICPIJ_004383 [Wickerhamomyces pijperi]|uniref:Cytochrome P450 n=1 Tax=Wickerhamomyces pijperi TaxID=599730 RepID=A0A9P8Q7T8_WICPI|nr:hypothetical protein WICPIJ_004383 [Wickerhamomyces pijperi]